VAGEAKSIWALKQVLLEDAAGHNYVPQANILASSVYAHFVANNVKADAPHPAIWASDLPGTGHKITFDLNVCAHITKVGIRCHGVGNNAASISFEASPTGQDDTWVTLKNITDTKQQLSIDWTFA